MTMGKHKGDAVILYAQYLDHGELSRIEAPNREVIEVVRHEGRGPGIVGSVAINRTAYPVEVYFLDQDPPEAFRGISGRRTITRPLLLTPGIQQQLIEAIVSVPTAFAKLLVRGYFEHAARDFQREASEFSPGDDSLSIFELLASIVWSNNFADCQTDEVVARW